MYACIHSQTFSAGHCKVLIINSDDVSIPCSIEVGEVITFLASDKASYITGTTIEITGWCGSHDYHLYHVICCCRRIMDVTVVGCYSVL